jgi:hypothetical protein
LLQIVSYSSFIDNPSIFFLFFCPVTKKKILKSYHEKRNCDMETVVYKEDESLQEIELLRRRRRGKKLN